MCCSLSQLAGEGKGAMPLPISDRAAQASEVDSDRADGRQLWGGAGSGFQSYPHPWGQSRNPAAGSGACTVTGAPQSRTGGSENAARKGLAVRCSNARSQVSALGLQPAVMGLTCTHL